MGQFGLVVSTGQRNHPNILKLDCKSRLRLRLNRATMTMKVTVWIPEHNHVCAPAQIDAKGKRILPEVVSYDPEVLAPKKAKSNRPTPYSRSARAPLADVNRSLPIASDQHLDSEGESSNNTLPMTSTQIQNAVSEGESDDNTQPTVSTEASPSLERLNQELFKFMNPESEAERMQRLRSQIMAQIKCIYDSIPLHETQKRNDVAKMLIPILKLVLNPPTAPALGQVANTMSKQ